MVRMILNGCFQNLKKFFLDNHIKREVTNHNLLLFKNQHLNINYSA